MSVILPRPVTVVSAPQIFSTASDVAGEISFDGRSRTPSTSSRLEAGSVLTMSTRLPVGETISALSP